MTERKKAHLSFSAPQGFRCFDIVKPRRFPSVQSPLSMISMILLIDFLNFRCLHLLYHAPTKLSSGILCVLPHERFVVFLPRLTFSVLTFKFMCDFHQIYDIIFLILLNLTKDQKMKRTLSLILVLV